VGIGVAVSVAVMAASPYTNKLGGAVPTIISAI
jgi:hypothetical protein